MARPSFLDQTLISKIARKLGKPTESVKGLISRRAFKHGISSEAALILLAKENGIGAATFQRKLDHSKQAEVRETLQTKLLPVGAKYPVKNSVKSLSGTTSQTSKQALKFSVEYLIEDRDLQDRCRDLLLASKNFDRAINQATLVLEDRIRDKAKPSNKLVGEALVNFAFNQDVDKTVLLVKSKDPDDQRGFTQILRGVVASLRNKTHHHLFDDFTREDALRVCGFIDFLVKLVGDADKIR